MAIFKLRDYQEDAVSSVRLAYRQKFKAVLLVLPTGAGKTVCFAHIAKSAVERGNNVMVLAHRDQLIKQASSKLDDYGVRHGIIMAGFTPDVTAKCQVASVQSLVRRLDKPFFQSYKPAMIIVDEAHLSAAKSYIKIFEAFPDALILGVTGSPIRLDGKPLGKSAGGIYDYLYVGVRIKELIEKGFLAKPIVYAPQDRLDLSTLKVSMGEFTTEDAEEIVDKPQITGSAVKYYKQVAFGRPAVAWCVTVRHAKHVRDDFVSKGIPAEMLTAEDSTARRSEVLTKLAKKEILVVTFVGLLVEGVDVPEIGCIIILRPTKSLSAYLQTVGRGLRVTDEKNDCIILDHAGLTYMHGFVDDEFEWSLDYDEDQNGKKKKVKPTAPIKSAIHCDRCHALVKPQPICPACGNPLDVGGRTINTDENGKLVMLDDGTREELKKKRKKEVADAKTLEDLLRVEIDRGYSPGWARHTFNTRQKARDKYLNMNRG